MTRALIVIDMFKQDVRGRYDEKQLISNQLKLIDAFKAKGLKVIFTTGRPGGPINPVQLRLWGDEYGGESDDSEQREKDRVENIGIPEELMGKGPDIIIKKPEYSAFYDTELEQYCKDTHISELFLTGISGGCCVYFTGVDAVYRHIQPVLVTDASSSPDPETHTGNIQRFRTFMGPAITTEEAIARLEEPLG